MSTARSWILGVAVAISLGGEAIAEGLPFIDDDYPRARAEAIRRKQLLVVERWAPW
jgi:hypothetical protein